MGNKIIIPEEIMNSMISEYENGASALKLHKKYKYSYEVTVRNLKENGVEMRDNSFYRSKYTLNENYFDDIDNENKAYWLGFFFADGYISKSKHGRETIAISITESDRSHLEKFKKDIDSTYQIKTYEVKSGYKLGVEYVRISMRGSHIINKLKEYGVTYTKSFDCPFPNKEIVPPHLIRHFIRGYFDGNGSIKKHGVCNGTQDYTVSACGTKDVIKKIHEHLPVDKKVHLMQRHPDRENNNYAFDIGGRLQVRKILDWLYEDANVYLERKYQRYLETIKEYEKIYKK